MTATLEPVSKKGKTLLKICFEEFVMSGSSSYLYSMKYALLCGLPLLFIAMIALAEPEDSIASLLESHLWQQRVLIMLSNGSDDSNAVSQHRMLSGKAAALKERDIVQYEAVQYDHFSKDGHILPHIPASRVLDYFDAHDGFTVILLGKDGEVKLRQNTPVSTEKLFALIDAMAMRQREMQRNDTVK